MGLNKKVTKTTNLQNLIPPSMEEIQLYIAGHYEESKTLHQFVQKTLGRLELIADEINFPELKFYISCMKSFAQKLANSDQEQEKLMDNAHQAFRKDNDSLKSEIKRLRLQIKENETDMILVEKLNREQAKELKSLKSALDKQIQRIKPSAGTQIPSQTAVVDISSEPQSITKIVAEPAKLQFASTSSARVVAINEPAIPQASLNAHSANMPNLTPVNTSLNSKADLASRPKSVLKRTTFQTVPSVAELVHRVSAAAAADDHKIGMRRNNSTGHKTIPAVSEVYQFKAAEMDSSSRPRGVSFKPIREESSAEPSPRRGASTRHRTPSTRGRSQSVHHDRSQSLRVITQHHEAETEEDYLTITHLRPNYNVVYLTAYNDQFVQAMKEIEKAPALGVDAEYKLERGTNVPTYLQIADDTKAYVFNLKLISASPQSSLMLQALWEFLVSKKPKVGQSLAHDLYEVSQWIIPRLGIRSGPQIVECWSLEEKLFVIMPSRTLGLTHISYRHLGKHMRKKQKECSAGGQRTIDNELQMEYVALDALAPLVIYQKYKGLVENVANLRKFSLPPINTTQALLPPLLLFDWNLMGDAIGWELEGFKMRELEAFTVKNLPLKYAAHQKQYPGLVFLVTADIAVIANSKLTESQIIPFFSKTYFDEQLDKIRQLVKKEYASISISSGKQTPAKPVTGISNGTELLNFLSSSKKLAPIVSPPKGSSADPLINFLQGKSSKNPAIIPPSVAPVAQNLNVASAGPGAKISKIVSETPYYQSAIPTLAEPAKPAKKSKKEAKPKKPKKKKGRHVSDDSDSLDSSRDLETDSDDHTPEPPKKQQPSKPAAPSNPVVPKLVASTTAKLLPQHQLWQMFGYAFRWSKVQNTAGEPCIPIKTVQAYCVFCGREETLYYHENPNKSLRVLGCLSCGNGISKQVDDDSMDVDQFYKIWLQEIQYKQSFAQPGMLPKRTPENRGKLTYQEYKQSKRNYY